MSCEGCHESLKGRDEQLIIIRQKAKLFAIENETNVFIYKDYEGNWQYMAEAAARSLDIQPTGGILSPLRRIAI